MLGANGVSELIENRNLAEPVIGKSLNDQKITVDMMDNSPLRSKLTTDPQPHRHRLFLIDEEEEERKTVTNIVTSVHRPISIDRGVLLVRGWVI